MSHRSRPAAARHACGMQHAQQPIHRSDARRVVVVYAARIVRRRIVYRAHRARAPHIQPAPGSGGPYPAAHDSSGIIVLWAVCWSRIAYEPGADADDRVCLCSSRAVACISIQGYACWQRRCGLLLRLSSSAPQHKSDPPRTSCTAPSHQQPAAVWRCSPRPTHQLSTQATSLLR